MARKIIVGAKYRPVINALLWMISGISIIVAFFTVPVPFAVAIALLSAFMPFVANKVFFKYGIIWVYPGLIDFIQDRLGFVWFKKSINEQEVYALSILYERKDNAKTVYSILRTWNYNKYKDHSANIVISIIDEGENKYSLFIYPGERKLMEEYIRDYHSESSSSRSVFNIERKIFSWVHNCADYSNRPEMLLAMNTIRNNGEILVNTAYLKDEEVESYAKKCIHVKDVKFLKREELGKKDLEYNQFWEDPLSKSPDLVERLSKVKI